MPRPTEALLDRRRIGRAALALVDKKGDFTIPELAKRLHVQPSSLYHHVDGRADIVELVRLEVLNKLDHTLLRSHSWDQGLAAWARSYRSVFAEHPAAIRMLATAPVRSPELIDAYEGATTALLEAGFPREQALAMFVALESFLLGSALDLSMPEVMIEGVDPERHAVLTGCIAALPAGISRPEQAFEVGLLALLEGFRASLGTEHARGAPR
ncbi:MAG TPA: TetR/AcrR family transcriptional regulator C-terminal domain-containing protein [Actinomycetota bacterium]|nr:TetR/AcrR family transcriptional regulator C-terminal domain-containing protein [Actinomycetota bacterium]